MTQLDPHAEILADLRTFLVEVIGEAWAHDVTIDVDTSFSDDLELESIEFVALAEKIQAHYGARVDFVSWLSNLELDAILALRVGDVVEYIARCR